MGRPLKRQSNSRLAQLSRARLHCPSVIKKQSAMRLSKRRCTRSSHASASEITTPALSPNNLGSVNLQNLLTKLKGQTRVLRTQAQHIDRMKKRMNLLKSNLKSALSRITVLERTNRQQMVEMSKKEVEREKRVVEQLEEIKRNKTQRVYYQKLLARLQACLRRRNGLLHKSKPMSPMSIMSRLRQKGTYTPAFQALVRMLVKSGCSCNKVARATYAIARLFGVTIKYAISRRTVSRCVIEGGIGSEIQIGYEMANSKGICSIHSW